MYVDAITTAAVVDELENHIVGGRVQDVIEVDEQSIGLEIYAHRQRQYLLMSVDPNAARCQLVPDRLRRGVERPSPLGLLLNKYVDGARLMAVSQPPWERIIHLSFSGHEGETRLIVETMDRRSNILLTVEGHILDCIKRIGSRQNRYRVMLPGREYMPPPPQEKAVPTSVTPAMMETFLKQDQDSPAWRALVENIAGVSPLFARQIVYFASGDDQAPAFDVAAGMIHAAFKNHVDMVQSGGWTPCIVPARRSEGYRAFAAYPLTLMSDWQEVESISEAMTHYFGAPVREEAYDAAKERVREQIDAALDRQRGKLYSLEQQDVDLEETDKRRKQGELILAYGQTLEPGQEILKAQYEPDGPLYEIELDPTLPYVENAQKYFDKYEKAKRAVEDLPKLKARARHEHAYLQQLETDLALADSWPEIEGVRDALQEAGYWHGTKSSGPKGGRPGIRRFTTEDGFVIFVGRNAKQNHELVTERSSGDDLWLHARDIPGSHVLIKNDGRSIPEEVIQQAAELAAYYSAGQRDTTVDVDVTERRYVRPIKGGKPGMVTFRNERTLTVRPQKFTRQKEEGQEE